MKITINIDNYSADFDDVVDYIAKELKRNRMSGHGEIDGCLFEWKATQDEKEQKDLSFYEKVFLDRPQIDMFELVDLYTFNLLK